MNFDTSMAGRALTTTRPPCLNPVTLDNVNETDRGDIAALIRAKLASGELQRAKPEKVWAGKGTGQSCWGCGALITPAKVEYEVDLAAGPTLTLRFHQGCLAVWDEARQQNQNTGGADVGTAA